MVLHKSIIYTQYRHSGRYEHSGKFIFLAAESEKGQMFCTAFPGIVEIWKTFTRDLVPYKNRGAGSLEKF